MPLVDKITSRLNYWANLLLSFAGRALLIKSVVCAIQAFWCSHFLLPTAVHDLVQSLLTRFLWKGNINQKRGEKIDWSTVCLPKDEGSLGLMNMVD